MLDPATKQRLLTTLMTFAESFSGNQPFDVTGFKSQSNLPDEMPPVDLSSFLDDQGEMKNIRDIRENNVGQLHLNPLDSIK